MSAVNLAEKNTTPIDYAAVFDRHLNAGRSPVEAAVYVEEDYLDGRPSTRGKRRITRSERDAAFWSCGFLVTLPSEAWSAEPVHGELIIVPPWAFDTSPGNGIASDNF